MKYVVFKTVDGEFRGFTTLENFEKNKNVLIYEDEGEYAEEFDGPEIPSDDLVDKVFYEISAMAEALCKSESD